MNSDRPSDIFPDLTGFSTGDAQRTDALFQYLHRKYGLVQEEARVGRQKVRFYRVEDPNELIDEVLESTSNADEHIPYWAELWPAAQALARFLAHQVDLQGREVVELGSGLGYVGLVAGALGAEVIFTDNQPDALRLCELNWRLNFERSARFWLVDWRQPPRGGPFSVILASDVVYERALFLPLISLLQRWLAPGGVFYLSEPNRAMARGFFEQLQEAGFGWQRWEEPVEGPAQRKISVSIYAIRRTHEVE